MSKSALAASVLVLLALAPVAMADEGFHVTAYLNGQPQEGATVVLWRNYQTAGWAVEAQAVTNDEGKVAFYHGNPVQTCDIPYTTEPRKLRASYEGNISPYSLAKVYNDEEDYFPVDLYMVPEE